MVSIRHLDWDMPYSVFAHWSGIRPLKPEAHKGSQPIDLTRHADSVSTLVVNSTPIREEAICLLGLGCDTSYSGAESVYIAVDNAKCGEGEIL